MSMIDRDEFIREIMRFKEQWKKVDPDRIDGMIEELRELWHENSDLSLGNLINLLLDTVSLIDIDDEDLLDRIKRARKEK